MCAQQIISQRLLDVCLLHASLSEHGRLLVACRLLGYFTLDHGCDQCEGNIGVERVPGEGQYLFLLRVGVFCRRSVGLQQYALIIYFGL